jgi:HK97 family phage portal protein
LESIAEAFRKANAGNAPEMGTTAKLADMRRSLVYACTQLRAGMLAGLPLRLYRWTDDDEGARRLDTRRPIVRAGKPRQVRGAALSSKRSLVEVEGDKLLDVLASPNEDWTLRALIQQVETSLCLVGQAHIRLHREGTRLLGMSFIQHTRMEVIKPGKDDKARTIAGWKLDGGRGAPIPTADVVWLRYPDPEDPDYGCLAPAQIAALGSEAYGQAMRSNLDIFRKGLRAGAILTPPEDMGSLGWDEIDELQQDVDSRMRGAANNHNVLAVPYRFGVERLDITPHDAEFVALLEFAIEDVARAFKVPIEMVGGTRRTYQNAEAADRALWQRCLEPEAAMIADELTRRLIPAAGLGPEYVLGFDLCDVTALQDDESLRWARDKEAIGIGAYQVNEWRAEMGLPELPESSAMLGSYQLTTDQAIGLLTEVVGLNAQQAAAVVAGGPPPMPEYLPPPATEDATRARAAASTAIQRGTVEWDSSEHRGILERSAKSEAPHVAAFGAATQRVMVRQRDSVLAKLEAMDKRGVRKAPTLADLKALFNPARWIIETREATRPTYRAAAKAAGRGALKQVGASIAWNGTTKGAVNQLMRREQRFAESVNDTTWDALKRSLGEGIEAGEGIPDLADRVRDVMEWRIRSSGELIARTEIHGTFESMGVEALRTAADELGMTYSKEWVSALDDRVRDDHQEAHGQTVGIDEEFEVGGARGMAPGEMGEPDQDCNCRCTSKYAVVRS